MPKTTKANTATVIQKTPPASGPATRTATALETKSALSTVNGAKKDEPKPIQSLAERFPAPVDQEVTIRYVAPDARDVKVAGNFNGWHPDATPLKKSGVGEWAIQLKLRPGKYEYRFVVDGKWCDDPHASLRGANPFGGFNSILEVPNTART